MVKHYLTHERLKAVLDYDEATGQMLWRRRPRADFKTYCAFRTFNVRFAGKVAGCIRKETGYREICIDGKTYRAHRLVWFWHHRKWPDEIDHEEGPRADNRIDVIRDVSSAENTRNCARRRDNTSGVTGVTWSKASGKWVARISIEGKHRQVCLTPDFEEAVAARKKAEVEHGYHPNHGRTPR